jgi:hypothetical protein
MKSHPVLLDDLDTLVAPAGGSDAAAGLPCAAVRAIIIVVTMAREK